MAIATLHLAIGWLLLGDRSRTVPVPVPGPAPTEQVRIVATWIVPAVAAPTMPSVPARSMATPAPSTRPDPPSAPPREPAVPNLPAAPPPKPGPERRGTGPAGMPDPAAPDRPDTGRPSPMTTASPSPAGPATGPTAASELPLSTTPPAAVAPLPPASAPRTLPPSGVQYLVEPQPEYPRASARAGENGRVQVRVLIDVSGAPREVQLAGSSGFARLDLAALAAVRQARFRPPTLDGQPLAGWATVPIDFGLER